MFKYFLLSISFTILSLFTFGQKATLVGKVIDDKGNAILGANVSVANESGGSTSDIDGNFKLTVPEDKEIKIIVSHISFELKVIEILLKSNSEKNLSIPLTPKAYDLGGVDIQEERTRTSTMQRIDPKNITYLANPSGSFEAII